MTKKQQVICERLGWYIQPDGNDIMLEQSSPAGEDFFFYSDKKRFAESIKEYAEDFDSDEHAAMWIENMKTVNGVPQSVRVLIDDADAIKEMLMELSEQINKTKRS